MSSVAGALTGLATAWNDLVDTLNGADTPSQAAVRATGIDPATGNLIAPQYAYSLKVNYGVDASDPTALAKFASSVADGTQQTLQQNASAGFQDLGGVSILPFSPVDGGDGAVLGNVANSLTPGASITSSLFLLFVLGLAVFLIFQVAK